LRFLRDVAVFSGDEQLDFTAISRHGRQVVLDHVDTGRAREFEESCHAVS